MLRPSCKMLLALLLLFAACNNANQTATSETRGDSSSIAEKTTTDMLPAADSIFYDSSITSKLESLPPRQAVPPPTTEVNVVIHQLTGYAPNEGFARAAADSLKAVLNSAGFKRAVLGTSFNYHNRGMSAQQIYNLLMNAHEEDGPGGADHVLDLRLRTITLEEDGQRWLNACNRSTIGIDGSGSGVSAVCSNWLRSTAQNGHYSWLAAHFVHEYMHILNFRHPDHKAESVPYKIHGIVEQLIEDPALRN